VSSRKSESPGERRIIQPVASLSGSARILTDFALISALTAFSASVHQIPGAAGYPAKVTTAKLYDDLEFQRACHLFT